MKAPTTTPIQVIDRLVNLLDALGQQAEPLSLKVLSAETGLHPSTAHRILASLAAHHLVERSEGGTYQLGPHLLTLASRAQRQLDPRREALPVMEWLRGEIGETVNLTVREGDVLVYIERVLSQKAMRVEQVIGSRAPLHVTAAGKLFLADEGESACADYAQRHGLEAYTVNTITDLARLTAAVDQARSRGYAFDDEEAELGVGCIGAPVRDAGGRMVAGLSVSAPIQRRRQEWLPLVLEAGQRLSARLGYRPVSL